MLTLLNFQIQIYTAVITASSDQLKTCAISVAIELNLLASFWWRHKYNTMHQYIIYTSKCSAIWMQISVLCFYSNYYFSSCYGVACIFKM